MPFLVALLGALGVAVFWWYRLKYMGEAANDAADAVGRVQGYFRRNKLRKKAAVAPVAAIDDPVTAAVTLVMAIGSENAPVSELLEQRIRDEARAIAASEKKLTEAIVYAKWATNQVADVQVVVDQTAKFLVTKLDEPEKDELLAMLDRVVPRGERLRTYPDHVRRLRQKLGLEVER